MSRRRTQHLTPTEWKIMKIVWERKTCASGDVYTEAHELHGWSRSTVKTILGRLVEKGYLKATPVGNTFVYKPARSALKSLFNAVDTLLDNALEGTTGPILAYIIKKCDLSAEEAEELQTLLEEHMTKKETE